MTGGKCSRCGAEDSMFWYPYAFGVAPLPNIGAMSYKDCQFYVLCDRCQTQFVTFMHTGAGKYVKKEANE